MDDSKIKHLEFIQGVINRMNSNSFKLKGWSITLISALYVLLGEGAGSRFLPISFLVISAFWIVDGFFISTERKFRDLYEKVRTSQGGEVGFEMKTGEFNKGDRTWIRGIFSKTLIPFCFPPAEVRQFQV